jgi:hypothetical protein
MNAESEKLILDDMQNLIFNNGFDNVSELIMLRNVLVRAFIKQCRRVSAFDLGFNQNAGDEFWVDPLVEHLIVHESNMPKIEWYAQFRIINRAYVKHIGEYVFYSIEAEHVERALSNAYGINVD